MRRLLERDSVTVFRRALAQFGFEDEAAAGGDLAAGAQLICTWTLVMSGTASMDSFW